MAEGTSDQKPDRQDISPPPRTAKEDFHASKSEISKFSQKNLSPLEHYLIGSTTEPIGGVYYDAKLIRDMIAITKEAPEEKAGVEAMLLTPEDLQNGIKTKEEIEEQRSAANEKLLYLGNYPIFSEETVKLGTNREDREKNVEIFLKFGGLNDHGEIPLEWEIELRKVEDPSVVVDDPEIWKKVKIRSAGKDMFGEEDPGEEDLFAIVQREGKYFVRFIGLDGILDIVPGDEQLAA